MYVMGRKQLNVSCNTQYVHVQKVDEQTAMFMYRKLMN